MQVAVSQKSTLASPVGTLMRATNRIAPEDTLERAAAEMRRNGGNLVPVVEHEILRGIVSDTSLAVAMAEGCSLIDAAETALVRAETIAPYATGAEALRRLAEGDGRPLVVVDDMMRPLGLIAAADLYPNRRPALRPAMTGGMATPFGVYLTTGSVNAGARGLALVSTGAVMFVLLFACSLAATPLIDWVNKRGLSDGASQVLGGIFITGLFLIGMRLLPLAGTHGAEHQVVHAIERGEELTPEVVRRMPRVHPRCGTNLFAGATIFLGIFSASWPSDPQLRLVLAAVAMWLFWRPLGTFLQQYLTTRRPSDRQLAGGIRAAEELLARSAIAKIAMPSIPQRLWNSGLFHVMAGSMACALVIGLVGRLFGVNLW